ncbi:hypothetical protein QX233_13195, partial [Chryseobacterium gambrini]|nr:hypothetical protein [Chryseobacterium gambrini]
MKNRLLVLSGVFFYTMSFSQVGINTPTPEATLDVRAKNHNGSVTATDGILVPRVNSLATSGSVNGQLVYLTQTTTTPAYSKGFYYWDGTKWVVLSNNSSSSLTGDVINVAGLGSGLSSPNAFSGATYNPNVPLDPTNIYINNTDGTTWTYNAAQNNYVSYIAPTSTEWNLSGTNTDAGSNKTTAIYRTGKITEGSPSAAHIDLGASGTGATGWTWMDFFDGTSTTTPKANLNWNPTQNVFTVNGMGTVTAINAGTTKGKVGVGTILPTAQMHVVGDARFGIESGAHTYTNADSSGGAWFDFYANESTVKSNLAWDNTNSRFNINGMGTVTTINAGNTKANVGVGYATPQTQLHVGGDARFGLGSGAHTYTNADSSGGAWFDFYANESTVKSNL